jgi:hypothetical protein
MSKLIIIPDVHGRSFWRKAVREHPGEEYIFLGDYLDPYPQDGVTLDEAFTGLEDIIAFKENAPDRVTLLWGNHDLHYLYPELEGSRLDYSHGKRNRDFFREHYSEFQIAAERMVGGKRFLFTHAGVGRKWMESILPTIKEEEMTARFFNESFPYQAFIRALDRVSHYRGGPDRYGSLIWADLLEQENPENQLPSTVQVFGHTMVLEAFNYENRIYGLDCQECFYLDLETGAVCSLDTGTPIPCYPRKGKH